MAGDLTQILSGAGLAGAAGHRAFLPPLLLGLAHRLAAATAAAGETPFFQLSAKFEWLADPKVIAIVAVLAIVEFIAERNPDAPEIVNLALKLPKAISGFIVAAAAMGRVDESLALLVGSGLLGSGVALGMDKLRADVKHAVQEPLSDATHGQSDKAMGWLETAWAGFLTVMAWLVPLLAVLALGVVVGVWFARRKIEKAGRSPCPACGRLCPKGARVCAGCKADLPAAADKS
jgi:hypothetical protein